MARGDNPASADMSFFIVLGPSQVLDGKYTAFGRVVDDGIENQPRALRSAFRCYHRGKLDDPEFDTMHVAIERSISAAPAATVAP